NSALGRLNSRLSITRECLGCTKINKQLRDACSASRLLLQLGSFFSCRLLSGTGGSLLSPSSVCPLPCPVAYWRHLRPATSFRSLLLPDCSLYSGLQCVTTLCSSSTISILNTLRVWRSVPI